ncbi:MAG: hypothetical protein WC865_01595 [Bacteroidales bacterium]
MNSRKLTFVFAVICITLFGLCRCKPENNVQRNDWLINGKDYIAKAGKSKDGKELLLSNGLIERRFRIAPNLATISIKNFVTSQEYLRSVRPEAKIIVDGHKFTIGGLTGQPVHSYLLPEWLDDLKSEPNSFEYTGYSVNNIQPRFPWKKRLEWMPEDLPWPPKGVELILDFKAPDYNVLEVPRKELLSDNFTKLDTGWRIQKSSANERISFTNEGKIGEIMALPNSFCFAERDFPPDAQVVQCLFDPGTDKGVTFGPGIALVFQTFTIKFNIRPGEGKFGIFNGALGQEFSYGKAEDGKAYYLKMTVAGNMIICEISSDSKKWEEISRITVNEKPQFVRIGKMGRSGNARDGNKKGDLTRSHVRNFIIFGEPDLSKAEPSDLKGLKVRVHYEIYDGIPLMSKWITIDNQIGKSVTLNGYTSEIIAAVEGKSEEDEQSGWEKPNIHVETDYGSAIRGRTDYEKVVSWVPDSIYTSQISWELATPCLLEVQTPLGPEQMIETGKSFESFHTWELFYDSYERERKSLSLRRMYRTIAPWVTENPILMHVLRADSASVKLAIDQCAEVGFEMVIMTFGSGFNMESGNPAYYQKMKKYADYAHSKGIALGGYSLLASRSISEKDDVINPKTGKPGGFAVFENSPCLGSEWGQEYFRKIYELYESSGLDIIEHDGSYPGDVCASTTHPGHKGLSDSQWNQRKTITDFYKWCRSKGIYLNVPDVYYLNGSSKCGMGYREVNWSLPRVQQEIIERQNIYEGTWDKTPSMGWMFVPLTQYHGGGAAATIEPLNEHLEHYNQRLANLFGAGVQACYRGPRLYDTDSTKAVVKKWVDFYKEHRQILDSDIIHLRRPDGRDWDGFLHVNPSGKEKGLLMLYNPLNQEITRTLQIPVYYTGLSNTANVREPDGKTRKYTISRDYKITLHITLPSRGYNWYVIY